MCRSGKSYLLLQLFVDQLVACGVHQDHIIQIALDDIQNDVYREPHTLYDHIRELIVDTQTYYVLLDEIQFVDRFAEVLNSLLRIENVDVYVTCSNSKFLSSDILTEFRGGGDELHVYPLSFTEYLSTYDGTEEDALNEYMTFGGLPRILSFDTDERKSSYLTNLFAKTYLKDIIEHNKIRNTTEMEDLVNILASSIGSLTNPHKLQRTFKSVLHSEITYRTITTYIDYLKDAFLISTAQRYDVKGRRYIGSPMKDYFVDLGLRNARLGFRQIEETHLLENMIFIELQRRGFSVDMGGCRHS